MREIEKLAAYVVARLAENRFEVRLSWDEDGDASVIASWRGSGDAHGRFGIVEENGVLNAYALIGCQGQAGGASKQFSVPADEVDMNSFVAAMKAFRADPSRVPSI